MIRDNRQKTSRNPLYGKNLDWNCLAAMRIVHDLHYAWISKTEEERNIEREYIGNLLELEMACMTDEDMIRSYCEDLAPHFSKLLETEITEEGALELSLDFFARAEPILSMEQQRERYKHSSIVRLVEMVRHTAFAAGEEYANSLWETDKEVVSKMEGSFVGKEVE